MSSNSSSVYKRSSFDAVESTRRLSEEMSSNEHSSRQHSALRGMSKLVEPITAFDYDDNNNASLENEANTKFVNIYEENEKAEHTNDNECREANVLTGPSTPVRAKRGHTGVRRAENGDMFEQRSVSDSDLDSPDDFSDGQMSDTSQCDGQANEGDLTHRRESQDAKCDSNGRQLMAQVEHNVQPVHPTDEVSALTSNANGDVTAPNITNGNQIGKDTNPQQSPSKVPEYSHLTEAEIDDKLRDDDVVRQGEALDAVREVGCANLNKLQHLNWDDPTLRRLFMKPRITVMEVKTVKVDPDIKNMVNEFLRTNVAENFVISRVLRENYAVFYAWLATHVQTERNAWTTRLAQALDQADQERKSSLQTRDLVVEAAARLRKLTKTSSNLLFGIPDKDDEMFFKVDAFRRQEIRDRKVGKATTRHSNRPRQFTSDGYMSDGNAGILRRGNKFRFGKTSRPRKGDLVPSNYRLVHVADNNYEQVNYDSDPGETPSGRFSMDDSEPGNKAASKSLSKVMNGVSKKMNATTWKSSKENSEKGYLDTGSLYSGYDLDGYIIEDDKFTDWNQVLVDSIEVLTDICDTLLSDRKSCLQILKANPKRYESLVEAVSDYTAKRHVEINDKRDIENRLRTLEIENRSLQEEMSMLQKTLADKNRDALNLQSQLDRLETMMHNQSAPKLHKCVGTNEEMFPAVFKNNLTVGGNRTPKQGNLNLSKISKSSKSPRPMEKDIKSKVVELPDVNGTSNLKYPRHKHDFHSPTLTGTKTEDVRSNQEATNQNGLTVPAQQPTLVREPSLIEISEEKLKTLKHRARKLEDSLHDAITSMEKLNKTTQQSFASPYGVPPIGPFYNNNKSMPDKNGPKTFKRWQKASFEVSNKALDISGGSDVNSTPRVAVIKKSNSFSKQHEGIDQMPSDVQITLTTEQSSLLEGRSIQGSSRDAVDATPGASSLRLTSDKTPSLAMQSSRSTFDAEISDEERSRHESEMLQSYRRSNDGASNVSPPKQKSKARRQRARHNTSRFLAGKQTVSKCLRCQKLFSPTDNHKLACCYHTKDKERLEHYDQSGMLIRVMYAWKCCHEPQESEGCCYGQHV